MSVILYASMILLMYFLSGIKKATNFQKTVTGFQKKIGFKIVPNILYYLIILLVIILEVLGPIIILGSLCSNTYHFIAYYCCIALACFTVLATLIYHFPPNKIEYYFFMKNLTATGALLLLSSVINTPVLYNSNLY